MIAWRRARPAQHEQSLRRAQILALLLFVFSATPHEARSETTLTTVRVAQGLNLPLFVASPPGDTTRLFIVEQRGSDKRGRIKILKNGVLQSAPFLTTPVLATDNEQGLLGLAFAPDYATSGRFFVNYTDSMGTTQIVRHTVSADPDLADPVGTVILSIPQPYTNHNGGWLGFGPDGYLYVATGDGGLGGDPQDRAQNVDSLLGKILRLDVSGGGYTIPPGNPFAGATSGSDEVWAYGLRNPWRPSFDRLTGDFVIADVGQGLREEIDFAPEGTGAGANYGWRCYEGSLFYSESATTPCGFCASPACPKIFPLYEYDHTLGRCSITGGYVYRGCAIPDLAGKYFFADYCGRQIYTGEFRGGAFVDVQDRTAELAPDGLTIGNITSFGEDAGGELYLTDRSGQVFKIVPKTGVLESDMPFLKKRTAVGDSLGSTGPGNALLTGIVPFADAGSRIRGVGYLKSATIRDCTELSGNCLTSHVRLDPFNIDLEACVDSVGSMLTRRFVFTNTAASSRDLAYVDVITPSLHGDPDGAVMSAAVGAGTSAVLVQADSFNPDRWIVHSGSGSSGVAYSADVDTASQIVARVAADQPLNEGVAAGPAAVGLALGFDFGSVAPSLPETVVVATQILGSAPSGIDLGASPPARGELRVSGATPFRSVLRLEMGLARAEAVSLEIFDPAGRRVRTLMQGSMPAGRRLVYWDGRLEGGGDAPSGIYFIRLRAADWSVIARTVLLR